MDFVGLPVSALLFGGIFVFIAFIVIVIIIFMVVRLGKKK